MPKDVSRRGWLKALVPTAADAVGHTMGVAIAETITPQRRPPGALPEARFLLRCNRCHDCIRACPHGAVLQFTTTAGRTLEGTPVMRPERRACEMCEGFPCAAACKEGALAVPEQPETVRLGRVRIRTDLCIAYLGPECGACTGLCPEGATGCMRLPGWRPEIDGERCNGCGRCIHACPTAPKAIEMEPLDG